MKQKHTLTAIVQDQPGVLTRIAGMFARRGYNIDSLTVGPTERLGISRIIMVVTGDDQEVEQITKQLNKLVDIVKIQDLTDGSHIERELMLVKVRTHTHELREEMKRMADIFRGRVIDVADKTYTIELTGPGSKLDAFLEALDASAILETVRTGASGIGRGDRIMKV
ncbi:MAG: acetolactate synthase small subunit [Synechococcaceae cyanobacterium RM1_1_27]|nr:acetolactate synthase small subunit [Synechococcaceae cyanobacterium RM1_1_27]